MTSRYRPFCQEKRSSDANFRYEDLKVQHCNLSKCLSEPQYHSQERNCWLSSQDERRLLTDKLTDMSSQSRRPQNALSQLALFQELFRDLFFRSMVWNCFSPNGTRSSSSCYGLKPIFTQASRLPTPCCPLNTFIDLEFLFTRPWIYEYSPPTSAVQRFRLESLDVTQHDTEWSLA